ncbi:hypothetical protein OAO87_02610 [bacterium]|nr:hypothetical protein [bacterium]
MFSATDAHLRCAAAPRPVDARSNVTRVRGRGSAQARQGRSTRDQT